MKKILIFMTAVMLFAINIPKSFKANFIQTIKSSNHTLKYKGIVCMKGQKIFWKYTYPEKKYIWIEDKIYVYEPDLMQVTISNRGNFTLNDILKNSKKISKNLYVTQINHKKVYFIYDKTLKKLYYTDQLGNKVTIKFYNQSKCENDKVFKINFPNDVDVVYENN
jgi:outer membrane lipoprotein carrier protein